MNGWMVQTFVSVHCICVLKSVGSKRERDETRLLLVCFQEGSWDCYQVCVCCIADVTSI